jgi:hypothetical protein
MPDTEKVTLEGEPTPNVPTPADVAAQAAKELREEESPQDKAPRTLEQIEAELAKVRREAANYRTKLREAEPLVKRAQEAEEANKTEVQRAQERAAKLEEKYNTLQQDNWRLDLAATHGIPRDEIDLIGSGSREEMEIRAARLGPLFATSEKTPPPPSNRPVEGLRPGASPEPPKPADNSYPAEWGYQAPRES